MNLRDEILVALRFKDRISHQDMRDRIMKIIEKELQSWIDNVELIEEREQLEQLKKVWMNES